MKRDITVTAETRETRGKNEARRLRARGLAPAVLYGAAQDSVAVSVNPKEVNRILRTGHNTIFNLAINGDTTPVMLVDWQKDPVKSTLLHVDLKRIDLTKRITIKVPVHTTGEPKGVKIQGGLFEIVTREIEVECLPDDIPESFTVDVLELMMGQSVRAGAVAIPESVVLVSSPDQVIAHVVAMRAEAVAEPAAEVAAPAAAEPEVIKKGKKEEEGAPAAEAKPKKK